MIKSMTGYAAAEKTDGEITVSADLRAYNSRHLDIVLRIPPSCMVLEDKIKGLVAERIARGRVEIRIQIKDESEQAMAFEIDLPRANAIHVALTQLKNEFNPGNDISIEHLLSLGGIIKPVEPADNRDSLWATIRDCLTHCLDGLEVMRRKEGDFIAGDLSARLDFIEGCLAEIKDESGALLQHYQERLKERITALTRETVEIDPGRLAQEAAFLADRSDISEEIVRAQSHVEQFRNIMDAKEPGGRKLNFLLQELNREFNTIGAKIGHAETSHKIVDIKSELEKIREQIQNVE
ncbi:MAG: YicC/YloC family endoribonuclease [Desulfobacteraceae bacterium]|jgi:uncharacterized protein (TIGR00255 family)|nr:YicC/YloC family endoribonuclease [Desulfobacteraceae bacterium]